jgi:hypothetical protein
MPQRIPGHFSFEPAGSLAASTAYGSFLEDFLEDIIELALRLRRGGRLAGGPVCGAGHAHCE